MSHQGRITLTLAVSLCLHALILISLSGQFGARSGSRLTAGAVFVELIKLGSRGAEARVLDEKTEFRQNVPEFEPAPDPKPRPSLHNERRDQDDTDDQVKKSDQVPRPSSLNNRLQPGAPETQQPSAPELEPETPGRATAVPVPAPSPESSEPELTPARCANCPKPAYPPQARERELEGEVVLSVQVLADGGVGDVFVLRSSGFPILDDAAIAGVKAWTFYPALRDGEPLAETRSFTINYRISPR